MSQMRWWGCWLSALGTLAMYYVPQLFGHNLPFMYVCAVVLGMGISAFVPMGAVFPALEPEHKGAAVSAHNLASGLTTFCGPFIATVLLNTVGFARSVLGICHLLHLWLGHLILDSPRAAGHHPQSGGELSGAR